RSPLQVTQPLIGGGNDFECVIKTLSQGVRNSRPRVIPYSNRVILGLRWSNDDLDLAKPQAALLEIFRTKYGFEIGNLLIPSTPGNEALEAINEIFFKLCEEYKLDTPLWLSRLRTKADILVPIDTSYSGSFLEPCHSLQMRLQYNKRFAEYLFSTGNEIADQNGPTYDGSLCTQANDPSTKLRYTPECIDCRKTTITLQHRANYEWGRQRPTGKAQIPTGRVLISVSILGKTVRR
ncbi:uncharacterized protein N7487_005221, partial [Penicillium crustosum]|uniref:uncharacterized protein n=1 Tax=Penicillium crustosum TaxID=36656 RepID=UPI0023A13DA1